MAIFNRKKKEEESPQKEGKSERILKELGLPAKDYVVHIFKIGPHRWNGKKVVGVGGGSIKVYSGDVPSFDEIKEEIANQFGGGEYMFRVAGSDGKWLKGVNRRFAISTEEREPEVEDEPKQERITPVMMPPQTNDGTVSALVAAMQTSTQSNLEAMKASASQNLEAMRMMMQKLDQDRGERREDQRQAMEMMIQSMKSVFEASTKSQETIVQLLQNSKTEMTELLKAMMQESKENSANMMNMFMQAFMQGMELGTVTNQPPKSELAEMFQSAADAFKSVFENRALPPAVDKEEVKETIKNVIRDQLKPGSKPKPNPEAEPAEDQSHKDAANKAIRYLIQILRDRPENTSIMRTLTESVPPELLKEAMSAGNPTLVFDWLEENGDEEVVEELKTLLTDDKATQWLSEAVKKEATGVGAAG